MRSLVLGVLVGVSLAGLSPAPCLHELQDISISPSDPSWENFSRVNNPLYSQTNIPAFIALPRTTGDIQRCLACATRQSIPISVKAGGHSFAGYSTINSPGFVISLTLMRNVTWASDQVVTVQAGATWIDVYAAFEQRGGLWVVTGGLCPSVGVAGFTMGGGVGPTARQFGLASDNLISVEMVTATGSSVVTASSTTNPDLFWALRGGGGGNFGVVVALTFAVHTGPPTYTFGQICFPSDPNSAKAILTLLAANNPAMPRDINVDVVYTTDGICFWIVYQGPSADAQRTLAPILSDPSCPKPSSSSLTEFNCFHELISAYAEAKGYSQYNDAPFQIKNCLINASSLPMLAALVPDPNLSDSCAVSLIHFGGKINDLAVEHSAFPWRSSEYMMYGSCSWPSGDDSEKAAALAFLAQMYDRVAPMCHGAYLNFIDRSVSDYEATYYGQNLGRLRQIKAQWNPDGVGPMHFQQEIHSVTIDHN
eukprot:c9767_g1_i1.p1 GENE.c9767_g1_i1~~c9767_g1_i1.p1  ORF type:complete len:480 (+),score=89.51 c9767_g1_i1:31-1470(+)